MQITNQQLGFVINPATWSEQVQNLQKTPAGLLNIVGWFGSTHAAAMWRKAPEFLDVFAKEQVVGFDPQIDGWDPNYAKIEAEIMASASVIVIRLENNELLNGSLGSIAEIGLALTSAALRGQMVIVSIEEGLLTSLEEPGAIAQYMLLEMSLERIEQIETFSGIFEIHRGDDLYDLARRCCQAAEHQMQNSTPKLKFDEFLEKRAKRRQNYPKRVLVGGSGGPYDELLGDGFNHKRDVLAATYRSDGHLVKVLTKGAVAKAWKIPYGSVDKIGVAMAIKALLSIENEYKQEADLLLIPIMAEAASKAAATEVGFLLLDALTSGQDIEIYLEHFDPVEYIYYQLNNVEIAHCRSEKQMRQALKEAGVAGNILATAVQDEVTETFNILREMTAGHKPDYRQIKKSLLGRTEVFHNADNIRRVRTLVQAHLERLSADHCFPDFFAYSEKIIN